MTTEFDCLARELKVALENLEIRKASINHKVSGGLNTPRQDLVDTSGVRITPVQHKMSTGGFPGGYNPSVPVRRRRPVL